MFLNDSPQKGTELFPNVGNIPTVVTVRGLDTNTELGNSVYQEVLPLARQLFTIQKHWYSLSTIDQHVKRLITEGGDQVTVRFHGKEAFVDIYLAPREKEQEAASEGTGRYEFVTTIVVGATTHMRYTLALLRDGVLVGRTKDGEEFTGTAGSPLYSYVGGEDDLFVNGGSTIAQTVFTNNTRERDCVRTSYTYPESGPYYVTSHPRPYDGWPPWSPIILDGSIANPPTLGTRLRMLYLGAPLDEPIKELTNIVGSTTPGGWVEYEQVYITPRFDGGLGQFYVASKAYIETGSGPVFSVGVGLPSFMAGITYDLEYPVQWFFSPHAMRAVAVRAYRQTQPPEPTLFLIHGIQEVIFTPSFSEGGTLTGCVVSVGREIYHREAGIVAVDYDHADPDIIRYAETRIYWDLNPVSYSFTKLGFSRGYTDWFGQLHNNVTSTSTHTGTVEVIGRSIWLEWRLILADGTSPSPYREELVLHSRLTSSVAAAAYSATLNPGGYSPSADPNDIAQWNEYVANFNAAAAATAASVAANVIPIATYMSTYGNSGVVATPANIVINGVHADNVALEAPIAAPASHTQGTQTYLSPDGKSEVYKDPYPSLTQAQFWESQTGYLLYSLRIAAIDMRHDAYAIVRYATWVDPQQPLTGAVIATAQRIVAFNGAVVLDETPLSGTIECMSYYPGVWPIDASYGSPTPSVVRGAVWDGVFQNLVRGSDAALNPQAGPSAVAGSGIAAADLQFSTFYLHPTVGWSLFSNVGRFNGTMNPAECFDIIAFNTPDKVVYGSHIGVLESSREGVALSYVTPANTLVRSAQWRDEVKG